MVDPCGSLPGPEKYQESAQTPEVEIRSDNSFVAEPVVERRYLPFSVTGDVDHEVSCANCIGACCTKGITMDLTAEEADFMREKGTHLTEIVPAHKAGPPWKRRQENAQFRLEADCGNLMRDAKTGQMVCAVYEDPRKPKICDDFSVGGYGCRTIRVARNVDPPEKLREWLRMTEDKHYS